MKMKKTDIFVVAFMYFICLWFYIMNSKLKPESQVYPRFCILLLFGLTTICTVRMIIRAKKYGIESDVSTTFAGFIPKQFFIILGAIVLYYIALIFVGFYPATIVFLAGVLYFMDIKPKYIVIVEVVMLVLIWAAFTKFLGVKLPMGKLFK